MGRLIHLHICPLLYLTLQNTNQAFPSSPLYGLLLFFDHMCQLLKDGAQLHNGALNVLHGVCSTLDVRVLHMMSRTKELSKFKSWSYTYKNRNVYDSHSKDYKEHFKMENLKLNHTCSSISCSWRGLALESMSMATSLPRLLDSSCINTELPEKKRSEQSDKNIFCLFL